MNDICFTSKLLKYILFADDTTVFYTNNDMNFLYDTVNRKSQEGCNWFKCNKLSLNTSKINLVLIGTVCKNKDFKIAKL